MDSTNADPRQSDPRQRQTHGPVATDSKTDRSPRSSKAVRSKADRQHTALIVALIVVVIAIMVGLSWALVSGQWSDEKNAKSSAPSSASSSLSSSQAGTQGGQKTGKTGKSGENNESDKSDTSDQSTSADDSGKVSASDTSQKNGSADRAQTPLPKVDKRAGNIFAATYKACGPGKQFSEDNISQESLILEKGNRTLTLLSGAKSDFSLYGCVVKQLGIPADQAQKMGAKKVSQGLQTFDFNGLTAQWSYSPSGLDLYVTQKQ